MLNLLHSPHGVTLIELLVGLIMVGILFAMGAPAFSGWIQNQPIRTAAESILNGIQVTRSEAVKNNELDHKKMRVVLNAFPKSRTFGFSLIELMIGIVIMAILAAVALPSFQTMLRNSQIRNAAESITNGLQRTRAEAVARNTNVTFVLGADSSWTVSVVVPASGIESRSANEGSKNVTRTVFPVGATTITFNNFGAVVANADASAPLTQVDLVAVGGSQSLRVTIGAGGNARMCDPNLAPGSSPRAC